MNRAAHPWQVLTPGGGEGRLKTRHPISNHQFRAPQTTGIRILKKLSPGRSALPSPVADGEKHLLPITSYAHGAQHRDGVVAVLSSRVLVTVLSRMRRTSLLYQAGMGPGGWWNGRHGPAVVAGCNTPPVLLSGKESLDFVTLVIQPLAVVDWFLAAATGRNARRDALLDQHLTDFVPITPLIPYYRYRRRQVFAHHISTGEVEVTALPLAQVEPQGTAFAVAEPMELLVMPPLVPATNQAGAPPLLRLDTVGWALMSVASIIRTSGSEASDADDSEKIRSETPCLTSGGNGCRGFCGGHRQQGHPPSAAPSE